MKILLVGNKYISVLGTESRFRKELFNTPGLDVYTFGWGYCSDEMMKISLSERIESIGGVDVILYSVFWKSNWVDCFNKSKALKVSIAPDLYEDAYRIHKYRRHYKKMKFDIIFIYGGATHLDYLEKMDVCKYKYHLPHCVDIELFKKHDVEKSIDVFAAYSVRTKKPNTYPYRFKIHEMLREMPVSSHIKRMGFEKLPRNISRSKICVNCNARHNFLNPRITEVMSCGSFLLTSYCDDLADFGYKDEEHLVTFHNMDDFKDKVEYFLKYDKEREEIAENGMKFVRENYSNKRRIETLLDIISRHL